MEPELTDEQLEEIAQRAYDERNDDGEHPRGVEPSRAPATSRENEHEAVGRHEIDHVPLRRRWMNGEVVAILPEILDVVNCHYCEPLNPVELRPALEEVAAVVDGAIGPLDDAATKHHRAAGRPSRRQTDRDSSAAKAERLDELVEIARRQSVARWGILRILAKSTGR